MSGFDSWTTGVRASLADSKQRGLTFEQAWRRAMWAHPPRQIELGPSMPQLDDEEPIAEFYRRQCKRAWMGTAPELADLPMALTDLGKNWPARKRAVSGRIMAGMRR